MRELGKFFRIYCSEQHTKWAKYINWIETILNCTTHGSTGFTPWELHWGQNPTDQISQLFKFPEMEEPTHDMKIALARERLDRNFEIRKKYQQGKSKISLKKGDLVLLRVPHLSSNTDRVIHKFFHLFEGPFKIIDAKGNNAFIIADPENPSKVKGTYNRTNLRKYKQNIDAKKPRTARLTVRDANSVINIRGDLR